MKANKVIRLVSGCLLVVAMMAIFWACKKESISEPSGSDVLTSDVEINKVIQNYFDRKNDLLIDGASQEEKDKFLEITSNDKNSRKGIDESEMISNVYLENNMHVKNVKTLIALDKIENLGVGKYEVIVSSITKTFIDAKNIETGEPMVSEEAYVYKILLRKNKNDEWLIENEKSLNLMGEISKYENSLIGKEKVETPQSKNLKIQGGVFNRSKAAKFAYDNAFKDITCSGWYNLYGNGDCTNFVSAALSDGGWVQDNTWWFQSYYCKASIAWIGANAFRNYLVSSNRVYPYISTINNLQLGDIVSADWTSNGSFDHTIIVTATDSNGQRYFSYHSNNNRNVAYPIFMARAYAYWGKYPTLNPFRLKDSY